MINVPYEICILNFIYLAKRRSNDDYLASPSYIGCVKISQGPVVVGIATLLDSIFIVRSLTPRLQEYDPVTFDLRSTRPVPSLCNPQDIAACVRQRCLYITDSYDNSVQRVEASSKGIACSKWSLGDDEPSGISVSYSRRENNAPVVMVTCLYSQKLYEFDAGGLPRRCVYLHSDLTHPHHALLGESGQMVVCHGYWSTDPLHRVCYVLKDGRVIESFGDAPGDSRQALNQVEIININVW